jgi:protoporphyrinogen oxidase
MATTEIVREASQNGSRPKVRPRTTRGCRIGIIGGGPGGLMTAYFLEKSLDRAAQITLFEASDRLGGKICTPQFASRLPGNGVVYYEAGAAEFYDYSVHDEDPLKELIAELGLSITPMGGSGVLLDNQVISNLDEFRAVLGPEACQAYVNFDRQARDEMPPGDFYHSDFPDGEWPATKPPAFDRFLQRISHPQARRYLETLIHSDLATEPPLTSQAYGLQNYLMNDPAYMTLYSIIGGNEQLPRELAARISARINFQQRITRVEATHAGGMLVTAETLDGSIREEFDRLIIALPHNAIPQIDFHPPSLAEAVRQHQRYYHYPAHYLRVTILFEKPFWRKSLSESYWMLDQFGGCCLYDESLREPSINCGVLGWLLAGDVAEQMAKQTDEELIAAVLDSLPEFLQHGRNSFVEGRVHRWVAAVNGCPGGIQALPLAQRHQPDRQAVPQMYLVGDYLFDSTINGVCDSAEFVAETIAAELSAKPQ